jgi:hypothetical protein
MMKRCAPSAALAFTRLVALSHVRLVAKGEWCLHCCINSTRVARTDVAVKITRGAHVQQQMAGTRGKHYALVVPCQLLVLSAATHFM